MKPTELGHERVESPETACARVEGSNTECSGRQETAACVRGVLSGIVVGGWESQPQGEGPDGSTQPAKETRAGHAGSEQHEPTSLRAIAKRARACKHHRFRDLYREVNVDLLRHCWHELNKDAASGVDCSYGYLVEADIRGFFDHMEHEWLLEMLSLRINDRAFVQLIRKWLKAGILESDGRVLHPGAGTPQGGVISPVLANLYLHYALDLWFERVVRPRCLGEARLCRYADDFVCAFRYREDAERFFEVLAKRLGKFGLDVAPEKTRIVRFSRFHPGLKRRVCFLGFELYWFGDRQGEPRVTRRTARKKLQGACRRIKDWIKSNRHLPGREFVRGLNRRLVGHYNYYGLRGNSRSLWRFYQWAMECAFKWLNRRGGKRKSFTWPVFSRALAKLGIAKPRITEQSYARRVFT